MKQRPTQLALTATGTLLATTIVVAGPLGLASSASTPPSAAVAPSAAQQPAEEQPAFRFEQLKRGLYRGAGGTRVGRPGQRSWLQVLRIPGGHALVDTSMVRSGIASATSPGSVQLAWAKQRYASGYVVLRDGVKVADLPATATRFADRRVTPGESYDYIVSPKAGPSRREYPVWGMSAGVPTRQQFARTATLGRFAAARMAASVASTSTISWVTFIPQAKIDAPPAGCSYGSGYQFGGDNRTAFDWTASTYRTAAHATVTWSSKAVAGSVSVRPTKVYRKSTGALVAQRTASSSDMRAYKLGSGSNYVDIRLVNHAANPFCSVGAIDGAITIQMTQAGNWAIRSGNFRRMPNHHIYIYDGGQVTNVVTATYQSVTCLIGAAACDLQTLTGWYGSF